MPKWGVAMRAWLVQAAALAAAALVPLLLGVPGILGMLVLLPTAVECAREAGWRISCAGSAAILCAWCLARMPQAMACAAPWCLAALGMLLAPVRPGWRRGAVWAALTAAECCGVLLWLGHRYSGIPDAGLAWDVVNWIDRQDNAAELLLRAYTAGYARLTGDLARLPAVRLFGQVVMTQQVRNELLYSLRVSLEALLRARLPGGIVWLIGLEGLVCAMLPDMLCRRGGRAGYLPRFDRWQLPRELSRPMTALLACMLLPLFTQQGAAVSFGRLCAATFQFVYLWLGRSVIEGLMKQRGAPVVTRRLLQAAGLVLLPFAPMLVGVADQAMDLRRLHGPKADEGGFEL